MSRTFKALVAAARPRCFGGSLRRAIGGAGDRVRHQRRPAENAQRHLRRRSRRRRRQFEGPDFRLHANRPSLRHARRQPHVLARRIAAVPVRSERQVRPRARSGRLRLQRRDRVARRSAGQRVDDRRGRQPGGEVRSRRAHRARARPQAGDDRRSARTAWRRTGRRDRVAEAGRGGARRCSVAPAPGGAGRRRRWRRQAAARAGLGRSRIELQPSDRCRVGSRRQHLRRRRHRQQQPRREVRQGRPLHQALGLDGHRARASSTASRRSRSTRRATSTSPTPATSASRCSTPRAPSSRSSATSARRSRCASRAGSTQHLYVSHAGDEDGMDDAAIYKVQLDGKVVGKFGSAGKLPKEFGLANSHRLPQRERAADRRDDQLARAEGDAQALTDRAR